MTDVYAWPPVRATGGYFTPEFPISKSRGMQGGDIVSSAWAERRVAGLNVSGVINGGGGYIAVLKRLLAGVHLVRLTTLPSHWHMHWQAPRGQFVVEWETGGEPVAWTSGGDPITWKSGALLTATLVAGAPFQLIDVAGFTPGAIAVYPDEVVQVGDVVTRSLSLAKANAAGVARIRVIDTLAIGGATTIGVRETGVYRIESDISATHSVGQALGYDLTFREVFEAETDGFVEVGEWW